eukprot:TRINITY_DN1099_c0_g1_i4.p1 TRINITY_DN1099_c0_g1~~TRINITY_DN1099_c0_g1_i4.p1  ORF type:complete len:142 (-),score=40.65 TRINITY_DN1099_c0_g1_i4:440-865(-)
MCIRDRQRAREKLFQQQDEVKSFNSKMILCDFITANNKLQQMNKNLHQQTLQEDRKHYQHAMTQIQQDEETENNKKLQKSQLIKQNLNEIKTQIQIKKDEFIQNLSDDYQSGLEIKKKAEQEKEQKEQKIVQQKNQLEVVN